MYTRKEFNFWYIDSVNMFIKIKQITCCNIITNSVKFFKYQSSVYIS